MFRARRSQIGPRLEMTPLIDVVFLLITFFVFSLALLVRVDLLEVRTPAIRSGEPAERGASVTIALDAEGRVYVNGEATTADEAPALAQSLLEANPGARLYLAADERTQTGALLELVDRMSAQGLSEFSLVGRPAPDRSGAEQR